MYIHTCTYMYVHVCMYTYMYIHMYVYMYQYANKTDVSRTCHWLALLSIILVDPPFLYQSVTSKPTPHKLQVASNRRTQIQFKLHHALVLLLGIQDAHQEFMTPTTPGSEAVAAL